MKDRGASTLDIIEPEYYSRFRCIGYACEDTCCSGMGVVIDKATFEKYRQCDDPTLGPLLRLKVVQSQQSSSPAAYATVVHNGPDCPFYNEDRDCAIQATLGEEYLSRTCDTYPRAYTRVDNTLERSLYLSCPEAARLILLRPGGIRFSAPGQGRPEKYSDFPVVDTRDEFHGSKPYKHLAQIRNFVILLLKNRSYLVWQRMVILGMYCDQLSRISVDQLDAGAPALTESFADSVAGRQFEPTLAGIVPNIPLLLNVVISSVDDRITSEYTSQRFIDCFTEFLDGIGYVAGIDTASLAGSYTSVKDEFYGPLIDHREYLWENYLVAKAYKDILPFGPQTSLYQDARTVYQEYVLLAYQYLFVRTMLVGLAGHRKSTLTEQDVVKLIQSFSRAIEHNPTYLSKILRSLEQGKIANIEILASLIAS